VSLPPVFSDSDRPAAIINSAGRWLADQLGSPYQWLPRPRVVQAVSGSLTVDLLLQGSSNNRAGGSTTVRVQLIVEDEGLRAWQEQHPGLCHRADGRLIAISLVNLVPSAVAVELYGPLRRVEPRILSLSDLAEVLCAQVLPVLSCLDSPAQAVRGLPDRWWLEANGLVEWALSRGDRAGARQMVKRYLTRYPGRVPAFRQGLAAPDLPIGPLYEPDTALGRLAATAGLVDPSEELPATAPARRRTLLQRLRGNH